MKLGMCPLLSCMRNCIEIVTLTCMANISTCDHQRSLTNLSYWKLKKALYGLRTSPLAWELERDNTLAQLQWGIRGRWYGLSPAKENPCLWEVVQLDAEVPLPTRKGSANRIPERVERREFERTGVLCSHWIPLELQRGRWGNAQRETIL